MHTLIVSYLTLFLIKQLGTTGTNSCGTYVHVLPGLELKCQLPFLAVQVDWLLKRA